MAGSRAARTDKDDIGDLGPALQCLLHRLSLQCGVVSFVTMTHRTPNNNRLDPSDTMIISTLFAVPPFSIGSDVIFLFLEPIYKNKEIHAMIGDPSLIWLPASLPRK